MHTIVRMESCMGMGWLFVLCWHLLVFHFSFSLSLLCHPHDSFALLQFKTSPHLFNSHYSYYCHHIDDKTATWENSTDCCSWVGVTCHPISGHVIALDLSCSGLQGEIPPQISHLSKLQSLDLSGNRLKWKESSWKRLLQNATVLRELVLDYTNMSSISMRPLNMSSTLVTLSLSHTRVMGKLTHDIPCLPHLQELYLGENFLEEQLPNLSCSAASLRILDLSDNRFQGPIPASFSNLTLLTSLHLTGNNLNGSIPSSLLTLPRLTSVHLQFNRFSGQIPNAFHHSNRFEELDLRNNNFEGEPPSTFSNLQHLIFLGLSGNLFTGQVPSSLFDLPHLSELDFSDNKLEGPLPDKVTGLSNATQLLFNNNFLNGTIPSWCLSLSSLVELDLSYNQFRGQIPAISSLSLESLYLCYNKLQGNIPQSILNLVNLTYLCLSSNNFTDPDNFSLLSNVSYSFSRLEALSLSSLRLTEFPKLSGKVPLLSALDLSNNKLKGTVPKWLHEMDSLWFLNLSKNLLTAPIHQFSRNYQLLQVLDLSFNSLTGGISSLICNASWIALLNLSHNKLTGIIPQCLANIPFLLVLDLQMNKFYGSLPNSFSKDSMLMYLNLNDNQLQGLLPQSLSNCRLLEVLNLANNQIEDTFSNWLQTLPNLKVLVLRANKLHGLIESSKSKLGFSSLVIFDISSNNFSGPIPKSYIQNFEAMKNVAQDEVADSSSQQYIQMQFSFGTYASSLTETVKAISLTYTKIPTNLVNIDLSGNKFEGEIPNDIGELHALRGLNLSHNRLSGPIPQSMGNLTNLESLDLSSNMLSGRIPLVLTNLNSLEVLNLSHNHLVGEIPQGKQFNTFSDDCYEGNLGLCGLPLTAKCSNDAEQHFPPSENLWREERFGFGWKPVAIGYGCGMVFGVGLGCCVLLIGKPQWLVRMVGGQLNKSVKRSTRMRTHRNRH